MPTYRSQCNKCNSTHDFIRKIDYRNDTPVCCGEHTARILTPVMIPQQDIAAYEVVGGDGRTYNSAKDYEAYLSKTGRVRSSDMVGEAEHQKKNVAAELDKSREKNTAEAISHLL